MKKHEILSPQARALLFDPPVGESALVRHYTLSTEDLVVIAKRRRPENRLGFALHLVYLRYPGRAIGPDEKPPAPLIAFIADQLKILPEVFIEYAERSQTSTDHLAEAQKYLNIRPYSAKDDKAMMQVASTEAIGTDRGEPIVAAMIEHLRNNGIILPPASELERIALAARAKARENAFETISARLGNKKREALEALLVAKNEEITPFAWLRKWSEKCNQKNLQEIVDRLEAVRNLNIEPDRQHRIHRARYAGIARENAVLSPQHISRFNDSRRLASLVVFSTEMEVSLTDAGIGLFLKFLTKILREADQKHKERLLEQGKQVTVAQQEFIKMARAVLKAKKQDQDLDDAVEQSVGWEKLALLVQASSAVLTSVREDSLSEVIDRYRTIHHVAMIVLNSFTFRSWKPDDPLIEAIDLLRRRYKDSRMKFPALVPTAFFQAHWRKLIGAGKSFNERAYEVAVIMQLRDRIRSGDIWVEGSRAYRTFDDFLLPTVVFHDKKAEDELSLGVPTEFKEWRDRFVPLLESRLETVDEKAAAGELPDASLTDAGLSISPIRSEQTDESQLLSRRLYSMLPRVRITDLLAEVNSWTGLADRFVHLQTGSAPADPVALMSAILADATNLGLTRMAQSSGTLTHSRLLWAAQMHIRDETYAAGLANMVEAIHAEPFTTIWGDGETSSSDGQFFRAGGHAEAGAHYNAHYSSDPGIKLYTHISDRYAPFSTKVIAANASEAPYVLDGLMHHETSLNLKEHYADTGGAPEHVFGLSHLLGFRFAPRIRGLGDRKLFVPDASKSYGPLKTMIAGDLNLQVVEENWDEILRMAASVRAGTVLPSTLLKKLSAFPRQNMLAKALREIGRLDRTLFTMDWITDPALRRRAQAGLNKGEARNALARILFFYRHGEIRDRTFENQCYRASGLNLVVAAIVLWNTRYLSRAVAELELQGEVIPRELLTHTAPLGCGHITINGDYIWPEKALIEYFRELRNPLNYLQKVA